MLLRSLFRRRLKPRKSRRTSHGPAVRRLRFETFEDRRMLSFTPGANIDAGVVGTWDTVTADFNNDGHLDVATAGRDSGKVSIILGNGQGGFGQATLFDVGQHPLSVAVGDFNEDGKLDLTTGTMGDYVSNGPSIAVLIGKGDGTFDPVKSIPTGWGPRSVAVGDFNADGHLDLGVVASDWGYYSYASVHHGDGHGNFAAPKGSGGIVDGIFQSATAADLNGDGADDLLITDNSKGPGGGVLTYLGGHPSGDLLPSHVLNYDSDVRDVAVGDLNEDGVADLVTVNTGHDYGVWVLLGDGQGGYAARQGYSVGGGAYSVVIGDFTGDGHLDICCDGLGILRGNGDGAFSVPERLLGGAASAAGDLNDDGLLDVISLNYNSISVLLNDGDWRQLPGDYNVNGTVDAADYVVWRKTLGGSITRYTGADGSGNGSVGPEDYDLWKSHFGQTVPQTTVFVRDAFVTEGNAGTTNAVFTVILSNAIAADVTVHYQTEDIDVGPDYALAGSDYIAASGDLLIPAGQTSATFTVAILGDLQDEAYYERFGVRLSVPTNTAVWDGIGTGYIVDDDIPDGINAADLKRTSNKTAFLAFTDTPSAAHDQPVTMSYRTVDGTATTFDNDYVAKTGTLTFATGETMKTITIEVNGDNKQEDDEYFNLELFDNSVYSLVVYSGVHFGVMGTILNDD